MDDTLRLADVNVTDRILFKKIDIDPNLLAQLQNNTDDENDNEVSGGESREFKSGSKLIIYFSTAESEKNYYLFDLLFNKRFSFFYGNF